MFCPECKAEYRPSFTRCADCDVDLVATLPEAKPESSDRSNVQGDLSNLQEVWAGDDQQSCVATCLTLKDAGIPYEVAQRKKQFLKGDERHFKITVPSIFYKQAKELAGKDTLDFSDDPEDQQSDADKTQDLAAVFAAWVARYQAKVRCRPSSRATVGS